LSISNDFVFSCCLPPSVNLAPSYFLSILPIYCSHLLPPALSTIVVCYLSFFLTKMVVSHWSISRKPLSHFCVVIVSNPHMVDVKPYLTSSLSNSCYANLHALLIKSFLSYHLLLHPIFLSHHDGRFVCARIKYFITHVVFFTTYLQKSLRNLEHA
jgi:hypothetical protein